MGGGVMMKIGGCIPVRIHPDFAWKKIEHYEQESMVMLKQWLESQQSPLLVDIGCSYGLVSCAGLFSNTSALVIAIDSDLQSLKAAKTMCSYAPEVDRRLSLIWGFASDEPTTGDNFLAVH